MESKDPYSLDNGLRSAGSLVPLGLSSNSPHFAFPKNHFEDYHVQAHQLNRFMRLASFAA